MDFKEGIWVIRKIENGMHKRYEGIKIEEVPDIMLRASFEPYRNIIYKQLVKFQNCGTIELTAKDVIDIIFDSLKTEEKK